MTTPRNGGREEKGILSVSRTKYIPIIQWYFIISHSIDEPFIHNLHLKTEYANNSLARS